ncbi:Histone-lysine N-methyltransferase set9 [Taphrina deformans PYCC 5710]|uniref:Histone-lysine N-methyltransferase SET9 n=1 Tax=Taphrina deformans (strain PYCC 5710 / ATCC 11124 / CBS 356.35 / IMI 108563 / JCM 9778 / NBRC 8474) TaxID=1097556 RepID=R4X6J9_TAPDE|nr:Histone-lysine N-methyltransferase set9 [Taphrina deformans PYCC 5710]|eukprot:CCG80774.1 Histone-lysine N-methyltransferase set9 [Taphrina deformans PYCC 5710]
MSKSLTLGRLSEYDDLLTDHLIDKHKNHSSRNVKTKEVVEILQQHVISSKGKLGNAVEAFLTLPSVELFHKRLNEAQRKDFIKHVRKYLCIYLPQAGFEICSTNRYPGPKSESCVIANKSLKSGEILKFLAGTIVAMTEEEEDYYEAEHDFSILHSSRLDSMCLFLGPARFVNHDCEPNGAFVTQGASIAITTIRPVRIGEELTVFYSPDYFGPNNIDCLCASCENKGVGGYRIKDKQVPSTLSSISKGAVEQVWGADSENPQAEAQNTKTNYVHTIEVATKPRLQSTVFGPKGQLVTPPNSELSLDELTKSLGWSNGESDQFDDKDYADSFPSDEDEDEEVSIKFEHSDSDNDFVKPSRLGNDYHVEAVASNINNSLSSDINSNVDRVVPKVLRPRRSVHDYNLKRQSLMSINPVLDGDSLFKVGGQRRDRKLNVDYCNVCDEELPFEAIVEEIWSVTEAVGIKDILCKRCERHAKLYGASWPKRIPAHQPQIEQESRTSGKKASRETTPAVFSQSISNLSNRNGTCSVSPTKKHVVMPFGQRECHSEGPSDRTCGTLPLIELAKARMKKGNINVPRLSRLHKLLHRDVTGDALRDPLHGIPIKTSVTTHPWSQSVDAGILSRAYPACLACRRLKQRGSRVEYGTPMCDRCHKLENLCAIDDDAPAYDHKFSELATPRYADVSTIEPINRVLSPDSLVAALQVRSPKKIQSVIEPITLSRPEVSMINGLGNFEIVAKARPDNTESKSSLPEVAQTSSTTKTEIGTIATDQVNGAEPKQDRRKSTKGSWYYVDVNSSDSAEDEPRVLSCRTRKQEQALSLVVGSHSNKTYIEIDSSDDGQPEVFVYKPPEKRSGSSKRKRRTPMWDYISIDSDEDLETVYTTDEPRAARRKAIVHYKE